MRDENELKNCFERFRNSEFRSGQKEAIEFCLSSKKLISVLCAPTGSGKSLIGMCLAANFSKPVYLCSSRQLQNQLTYDFPEADIMWGRRNFTCNLIPIRNASQCIHSPKDYFCPHKNKKLIEAGEYDECHYEVQKNKVLYSPFPILNYHYFITEANYVGRFSNREFIICDEADTLENILASFIDLTFPRGVLNRLKLKPPKRKTSTSLTGVESWVSWAEETGEKIDEYVDSLFNKTKNLHPKSEPYLKISKVIERYKQLKSKLELFISNVDNTWIFEEKKDQYGEIKAYEFKPTWLTPTLTKKFLFSHAPKFVFMSATFPPTQILAKIFGLSMDDIDWLELPSSFPVENRQVILKPSGDLSYKNFDNDVKGVLDAIKEILEIHETDKGLVHSVSYKLTEHIMSINNPRLITHNADNKLEVLDEFIKTDDPMVFVSPSSTRGLDLPDDSCRFVIIAKAPYLSLADKLTKSRVYSSNVGQHWYASDAAQEIVQSTGRAVRSPDDWAVTYVLDNQAYQRIIHSQGLFPRYYLDAVDIQ
jgi:Rad3-related DNA helicase